MSMFKVVGLVAVLASLAACADDDTQPDDQTSESKSQLSQQYDGYGNGAPLPNLPPGDWQDPGAKLPPVPGVPTAALSMPCEGTTWQRIWDPVRGWREIAIHRCE